MGYAPSPRPSFDEPTHIPYHSVTRHLWGDPEAGEVADWIYVSSDKIHQIVFGMPLGGNFTHSDAFRTVFGADELLYVVSGEMLLANPETGEVHRVPEGKAAFFRKDTWHHAYCIGDRELRVLEFFAPPPSQGTSGAYARTRPNLLETRYTQDDVLGRWPMDRTAIEASDTITVLADDDLRWRYEGTDRFTLTGLYCATDQLTVGKVILAPGQRRDIHTHGGQESLYVTRGPVHIATGAADQRRWFELQQRDGFFIPEGVPHAYHNMSATTVELLFAVAPTYLPGDRS